MQTGQEPELFWESTYAIALSLIMHYPEQDPTEVGLEQLTAMVESLPNFVDDPAMVTERILMDIQIVWYEEASSL